MRRTLPLHLCIIAATTALQGCAMLEPNLHLPRFTNAPATVSETAVPFVSPTVPGSWQVAQPKVAESRGDWWKMYNDPDLDALMAQASQNNPSLQVMAARVRQARALASQANAALFPAISADAGITRAKQSPAELGLPQGTKTSAATLYNAGLSASYEVDLFGRVSGQSRTAAFQSLAQSDLYNSAKLALEADVVNAWYSYRAASAAQNAIAQSLKLGEESLALLKQQLDVGDIPDADYQQSLANLLDQRNTALDLARQRAQAQNQLAFLLGVPAGSFTPSATQPITALPPIVPQGIPSMVLERRPDVAAAEHQLAAANAQIGVARAAFFPSLNLTASGGFASTQLSNLFNWNNVTWSAGPLLSLPIFQGGALLANLRYSRAAYDEAVASYKAQLLTAFQEVSDALTTQQTAIQQASGRQQAVAALQKSAKASNAQLQVGDISKLQNLGAQQSLLSAQALEQQALANAYIASTQTIRALGGGFTISQTSH